MKEKINNAIPLIVHVNIFEVAVLRILIKRRQQPPLKLSTLVSGFPDDAEDNVLSAISNLRLQGYIMLNDYQPSGYVSINRDRRKDILQIVDSDIQSLKFESPSPKENELIPILGKKSPPPLTARHKIPPGHKAIAISSLLIIGLVSTVGISIPVATSPDSGFIAYHGYIAHNKWTSAQGADDYQVDKISSTLSPSFVALKDCNESTSYHHQQT